MEDRYSVLIKLENRMAADGFYCSYNGKRFKPTEVLTTKITRSPLIIIVFCFYSTSLHFLTFGWSDTFRLRFAIYILLNLSSTPTLQKLQIYPHLIILNCPPAPFVLVSHFASLKDYLLFRFVCEHLFVLSYVHRYTIVCAFP